VLLARKGRMTILRTLGFLVILLLANATQNGAKAQTTAASTWITLGTSGGAIPNAMRSQPAHLLESGNQNILVDCGDGAAEQLAKVGIVPARIHTIFISHLHFDHIGGLFGLLGLRFQVDSPGVVTIYGPPGIKATIDGLMTAAEPMADVGAGIPGQARREPRDSVKVIEITGGQSITIGDIKVTAATNTHYSFPPGSPQAAQFQSLSYRFDLPYRSIVFTGDTGPSTAVERLAQGADLLVTEIAGVDGAIAAMKRSNPSISEEQLATFRRHLLEQHLAPDQVGLLASRAGVKKVVLVHNDLNEAGLAQALAVIGQTYHGPVVESHDLDRF
jgi:ribonuclease BN (tRNA processing enzyme)